MRNYLNSDATTRERQLRVAFGNLKPLLFLIVCCLFLVFKVRSQSYDVVTVETGGETQSVYLCGYKHGTFCEAVFTDFHCEAHAGQLGTSKDFLLVGMHAPCTGQNTFLGTVVYINGEPNVGSMVAGSLYLGPVQNSSNLRLQLYFVTLVALKVPQAVPSFTQRRFNTGDYFLMYVSRRCLPHREKAFIEFASLATVVAGGKCNGSSNTDSRIKHLPRLAKGSWKEAHLAYSTSKFGLVMENTKTAGYITEKILNAFIGGTVPIYYGTEEVFEIFNRNAFVYYDEADPTRALELVRKLSQDEHMYRVMLEEPILAPGAFEKFFSLYNGGSTSKRIRAFLGLHDSVPVLED